MSTLFKADHARHIELAGVGPALRPVDIDQSQTGFAALRTLRIYHFEPPAVIHGHAEEDEVFIVVLQGEIELQMRSEHWSRSEGGSRSHDGSRSDDRFTLRAADAASPVTCAAYLPPHAEYALTPRTGADVAYARALPAGARSPAVFSSSPRQGTGPCPLLNLPPYAERLRLQLWHVETREEDADLIPADRAAADTPAPLATAAEMLIHVRSAPARAVTAEAPGLAGITLDSWDTLAVYPGEQPRLRVAARSAAWGLIVGAA